MKFSGHETFACRYAWLPKAYRAIVDDPSILRDEERAMVGLGVGKNMVRSIRFWGEAMNVIAPMKDKTFAPTIFGTAIFDHTGFDPFLEDVRTLWLLHWNIAARVTDPLFAWDFLFNRWPYPEFTRSEVLAAFVREAKRLNVPRSEVTLKQHLDVFLQSYVSTREQTSVVEDSLDCPLAELELLQVVGVRRTDSSARFEQVYSFRREAKPEITAALFEYCLDDYWRGHHATETSVTYREVAIGPYSIGQVFQLPEDDIRGRLDTFTMTDALHSFSYQPSAVQGIVFRRNTAPLDLLTAVYAEENTGV